MRLTELEPTYLKVIDDCNFKYVDDIKDADGIDFLCPKCFSANNGSIGTHHCICWNPSVPQTIHPIPGRWEMLGDSFENLSLRAGSSSVQLNGGCNAHFFIENGEVRLV